MFGTESEKQIDSEFASRFLLADGAMKKRKFDSNDDSTEENPPKSVREFIKLHFAKFDECESEEDKRKFLEFTWFNQVAPSKSKKSANSVNVIKTDYDKKISAKNEMILEKVCNFSAQAERYFMTED